LAACGSVLGGAAAHAVVTTCSTAFYAWPSNFTPSTTTSGPASAAANDTLFNTYKLPNKAYTYFAQGPKLYCYRNVDEGSTGHNFNGGAPDDCATNPADCAAGTVKWAWTSSATIQNFPEAAPLTPAVTCPDPTGTCQEWLFVSTLDGFLNKINANDGCFNSASQCLSVDTRRVNPGTGLVVCPTDQLLATPAVQLNAYATGDGNAFRNNVAAAGGTHASNDDVVFVATYNQCGDHTHNRVIAYWASNLTVKWTFNANTDNNVGSSPFNVDAIGEGIEIHYDSDTLVFGTVLQNPAGTQDSLFALNSLTGARKWSYNAGSIANRPAIVSTAYTSTGTNCTGTPCACSGSAPISPDRIYVASNGVSGGLLQAFALGADPTNAFRGLPLWHCPNGSTVTIAALNVNRTPWRYAVGGNPTVVVVDTGGNLRWFSDLGDHASSPLAPVNPSGTIATTPCTSAAVCFTSMPVTGAGKIFVGRNDGRIQQLSATGTLEGAMDVNPNNANQVNVYDPTLDIDSGATDVNKLVVVADAQPGGGNFGKVTRIAIPICTTPP
jgi:hypothetical protein